MIPLKLSQLVPPPRQHNLTLCGAARRRRSQASGPTSAGALLWRYSKQHVCLEHRHSNGEYEEEEEVGEEGATRRKCLQSLYKMLGYRDSQRDFDSYYEFKNL